MAILEGFRRFSDIFGSSLVTFAPTKRPSLSDLDPMTRSKNQCLLTVLDEFSEFPVAFPLQNITSSDVIKCYSTLFVSPSSETLGSFTPTGAQSSCHRNSKISAAKMEWHPPNLRPAILRAMAKTNYVVGCSVPVTLHKPPFREKQSKKISQGRKN